MFSHPSESCGGTMKCSVYLPPQAESSKVPVLYWLSGLTCTHENFITKAGAQKFAAELGIMLVAPDTSPREAGICLLYTSPRPRDVEEARMPSSA